MQVGGDDLVLRRKALRDWRFGDYAKRAGLADADHARGKLEHLWLDCYELGTDTLPEALVEERLGVGSADRLVESSLAFFTSTSPAHAGRSLVIHGADTTALTRSKVRKQRIRAGKARAATATRLDGVFTSGPPAENSSRPRNEPAELPAPSRAHLSDLPDQGILSGISASPELSSGSDRRSKVKAHTLPDDWKPNAKHADLARKRGLDLDEQADSARDWCKANNAKKANWDAFFNNWLRNARTGRAQPTSVLDAQLRRIADLERAEREGDPHDPG